PGKNRRQQIGAGTEIALSAGVRWRYLEHRKIDPGRAGKPIVKRRVMHRQQVDEALPPVLAQSRRQEGRKEAATLAKIHRRQVVEPRQLKTDQRDARKTARLTP